MDTDTANTAAIANESTPVIRRVREVMAEADSLHKYYADRSAYDRIEGEALERLETMADNFYSDPDEINVHSLYHMVRHLILAANPLAR